MGVQSTKIISRNEAEEAWAFDRAQQETRKLEKHFQRTAQDMTNEELEEELESEWYNYEIVEERNGN